MAGPEKKFENQLKKVLTQRGAWYIKNWAGLGEDKGIPDILVSYNGYFLSLEVKRTDGKGVITPVQKKQAKLITESGSVAVFISKLSTLDIILDWLDHHKDVTAIQEKYSQEALDILHLNHEPMNIYSRESIEGVWR